MKNVKIMLLGLLTCLAFNSEGQPGVSRGTYGTQSSYASTQMNTCNAQGTIKVVSKDTLSNGDTGYTYVFVGQGFDLSFDLLTTTLTGTVASTSNILYGVNNSGKPLTAAQVVAAATDIHAITGNTTYCAGCVGASSTTVPGASKHYVWQVPKSAGALFDNYIMRTIQTGTCTATYSSKVQTQY